MAIAEMKRHWLAVCTLAALASVAPAHGGEFTLRLAHDTAPERQARAQFERVLASHALEPWIQTREIVFERGAIPHSHPVLTLNTRHTDDDGLLISTFIHEQTH